MNKNGINASFGQVLGHFLSPKMRSSLANHHLKSPFLGGSSLEKQFNGFRLPIGQNNFARMNVAQGLLIDVFVHIFQIIYDFLNGFHNTLFQIGTMGIKGWRQLLCGGRLETGRIMACMAACRRRCRGSAGLRMSPKHTLKRQLLVSWLGWRQETGASAFAASKRVCVRSLGRGFTHGFFTDRRHDPSYNIPNGRFSKAPHILQIFSHSL
mmetsp:Transcript_2602/g.5896  ORF Transcript_2602/g.5896 Transcript_2602/m.5896 type:complete len:210 (-) Transcript_2602:65-694(-)